MQVTIPPALSPEDRSKLGTALRADVAAEFGPVDESEIAILLHDDDSTLQGGLVGTVLWGWLYIRWLWVEESHRGMGWGQELLRRAEEEVHQRGCRGVYIDTFSPRAMALYERCGYTLWGVLDDFPPGHSRRFLKKEITH
ncbi:MAG: GNAT family N-acetyltransferase [Armatimonas sp.]